jgi:phenylpropionate dioxygenase-like ring-hydroxylating dioxygenase large terminal subunit
MYINFWYAAAISDKLTDKPIKVRMLSHDFVLFRDSQGKAHCLSDTCIHRGAALSGGKMRGDCIQCPYHGWQFAGDGECKKIPSLGPGHKVPSRARIDAYPTTEKYGLVFAFLGDLPESERTPIMDVPEWKHERDDWTEGWRGTAVDYYWEANYERAIENGLDPAHNEFVHPTHGFSGDDDSYKVGELRMEHTDHGFGFMHTFKAPAPRNWLMRRIRNYDGDLEAGTGHHGPNHMWTRIHITPTKWFHQYVFETPVDEGHLHTFLISLRNMVLGKWADKTINGRNFVIAEQDRVVMEKLRPVVTPPSRTKELLMPADRVIGLYRDKLDEWDRAGYRIDTEALNRAHARGDTMFAIPSPGRRETRNWVLDPVPLIPPSAPESATVRAVS